MDVAIRVDASVAIGTGHVRRCLSLADTLSRMGCRPRFVMRRHDEAAVAVAAAIRHSVEWLPAPSTGRGLDEDVVPHAAWAGVSWAQDVADTLAVLVAEPPEWVVVDHYAFDSRWHDAIRVELGCRILAIDDLGDRSLAADVLLDGNVAASHDKKFSGRLRDRTRLLVGPRFALLASAYRAAARARLSPTVNSIGIFMGGTDLGGASAGVLTALRTEAGFDGDIEIVSTSANPEWRALEARCVQDGRATLVLDLPDLSDFYARHDLHIGAGGTSSYERCCVGAATIAVVLAENQLAVIPELSALGAIRPARLPGMAPSSLLPDLPSVGAVARELIADSGQRHGLSRTARALVDGRGAERAALVVMADRLAVRAATPGDAAMLHAWRNDPVTREVSIDTRDIPYAAHVSWLEAVLAAADRRLFIAEVAGVPVGAIRFDRDDDGAWEISLYMDPALHGLGLGGRMLLAGERAIVRMSAAAVVFDAQVVEGNEVSARMFARAGYARNGNRFRKVRDQEKTA